MYHYEKSEFIPAKPEVVFTYADDFRNFSSHMNKSSWMMGGGKMETQTDDGNGQKVGSHIKMEGKIFGMNLFLDEAIIIHEPPFKKAWKTVGYINLIVIDHYTLGFEIKPDKEGSVIRVYIDYQLPKTFKTYLAGVLLGNIYAQWCVSQMIDRVKSYF